MKYIGLIMILVALFVMPVSAETGTITVDTRQIFGDYTLDVSGGATVALGNFSVFKFYNSGYDTIVNMSFQSDGFSVPNQSNVTHFTIVDGGTGGGYAAYSKATLRFTLNFESGTTITSSVFRVSYDSNIFDGVSLGAGGSETQNVEPTASKPVCVVSSDGRCIRANDNGAYPLHYGADVSTDVSVNYVVDYPMAGKFRANITKPGTIATNVCVNSSTAMYVCESGFSLSPLNFFGTQLAGIYINVTHSGGDYNNVLVNASGIPVPTPLPTGAGGSVNNQLSYDYSSAVLGNTYGVNVSISDANYTSLLTTYRLKIYDTSGLQVEGSPIEFQTQRYNTSRMWRFALPGLYSANLSSCAIWECLIGLETQMDSASLLVTDQPFAYNVSTDKTTYTNGDIINISVRNPSSNVIYLGMFLQVGGQTGIMDYPVPGNTNLSILQSVGNDFTSGNWEVALYTGLGARGKVANYVFSIGMPSVTEDKLGLRWGDQYFFGRSNPLYYKSNFNTSTVKVYKVFPGQKNNSLFDTFDVPGNTSSQKAYLMDSMGVWNASITDTGNSSNVTHANMTVLGNKSTDCSTNTPSYICFDKRNYVAGDTFILNMRISDPPLVVLNDWNWAVLDPNNKVVFNGTVIRFWECCFSKNFPYAMTATQQWKPTAEGKYHAILVYGGNHAVSYSDGDILADDFALVTSPPVGEAVNLPGTGTASINAWAANIMSLLGSMFFWGLMLLLGFAITVYSGRFPIKTKPELAVMGFAFIETIGGLFAPYTIPIFVVIVIIIALMFRKGQETIGQE